MPAVYAVTGATGVASIGNATVADGGSDVTTGLAWGRYGGTPGATIGITDRISGANLGTLDVSKQSMHFITSGVQSGPVALPVSGTATYTLIGNTNPTDNLGNVGTLGSATVKANFSAQTVTTAVELSVAGSTWAAGAKNIPIVGRCVRGQEKQPRHRRARRYQEWIVVQHLGQNHRRIFRIHWQWRRADVHAEPGRTFERGRHDGVGSCRLQALRRALRLVPARTSRSETRADCAHRREMTSTSSPAMRSSRSPACTCRLRAPRRRS